MEIVIQQGRVGLRENPRFAAITEESKAKSWWKFWK
jgi:hypothetical protein